MRNYPLEKYKFFSFVDKNNEKNIVAVSTYAGKTVRAKAICSADDTFDELAGKKLAAARCNAKIATKRTKRAESKMNEALEQLDRAQKYYDNMVRYFNDAATDEAFAQNEVVCLESEM